MLMASLRNGHANRLYAAQNAVFSWHVQDLDGPQAVQAYCDKVVRSVKFKALWVAENHASDMPPAKVKVVHITGWAAYHQYGTREIRISKNRRSQYVVLHELAHMIATEHGHGRQFARIFLALVRRFLPEHGPALLAAYGAHGVRYRKSSRKDA